MIMRAKEGWRRAVWIASTCALTACGADAHVDLLPGSADSSSTSDAPVETTTDASDTRVDDVPDDGCVGGACACGLTSCGTGCVDVQNDPSNCKTCGGSCQHHAFCASAACTCLPGLTACGTLCTDTSSDPDHCGGCANPPCSSGQFCVGGHCTGGPCTAGTTPCAVAGRTACVDLASGLPFCGGCGIVCAPTERCAAGLCQRYAPATPCAACPCDVDCARALGTSGGACCAPIAPGGPPTCVVGGVCP